MKYQCVTTLLELKDYLVDSHLIAFDFETAPLSPYRDVPKVNMSATLDTPSC